MSRYNDMLAAFRDEDDAAFAADIAAVMATAAGRRLFSASLAKGGVYRFSRPDDNLAYHAGRRDAALEMLQAVNRHALKHAEQAQSERNALMSERNRRLADAANEDRKSNSTR